MDPNVVTSPSDSSDPSERIGLRVEELSARSGLPVRTIREYQTWRLLHPPRRVGRVGLYDDTHVQRLRTIGQLQARGYSIAAIRDLLDAWSNGAGLREVLGVDDAIVATADEAPILLSQSQLAELLPSLASSPRLLARACRVGVLAEQAGGYVARSGSLLQLLADAIDAGLSPGDAIELAQTIVAATDTIGRAVADLVASSARHGDRAATDRLLRRGRVLLAHAVASHTIDQVGRELLRRSQAEPALGEILERVRIGAVTTDGAPADRQGAPRG